MSEQTTKDDVKEVIVPATPKFKLTGKPGTPLNGTLSGKVLPLQRATIEDKITVQKIILGSKGITLTPLNKEALALVKTVLKECKMLSNGDRITKTEEFVKAFDAIVAAAPKARKSKTVKKAAPTPATGTTGDKKTEVPATGTNNDLNKNQGPKNANIQSGNKNNQNK